MRFACDHLTLHQNTLIEQSSGGKDWTENQMTGTRLGANSTPVVYIKQKIYLK